MKKGKIFTLRLYIDELINIMSIVLDPKYPQMQTQLIRIMWIGYVNYIISVIQAWTLISPLGFLQFDLCVYLQGSRCYSTEARQMVTMIPGDGIGPEISQSVKDIFSAAGVINGLCTLFAWWSVRMVLSSVRK